MKKIFKQKKLKKQILLKKNKLKYSNVKKRDLSGSLFFVSICFVGWCHCEEVNARRGNLFLNVIYIGIKQHFCE